ncbi:MAG: hypothetical protein F4X36_17540 [Gammaproteobacteria bacterium]|nr:hypothetical protein [Gammaproteobacteria bacterium]
MESNGIVPLRESAHSPERECPLCGAGSITTDWIRDSFEYGTGDSAVLLEVDLPVRRCGPCDFEFLDHEGERLRHETVCRHLGVLSPAEISGIRKAFRMSRAALADVTGLGEATLGRWENGAVIQNRANDRYLRLLSLPGVMGRLMELAAPERPRQPVAARESRFRILAISDETRAKQGAFQLRLAS